MMEDDSQSLLLRFSRDRSEDALRALIKRHAPLVHSTALRYLNGDRSAAQDVTQEVFTLLVRKAAGLQGIFLSGWLHRQACRRAANHVRTEQRRRKREKIASETMEASSGEKSSPFLFRELDDALLKLSSLDRDAVTLRFFEGRDYRSVATVLGITEEAARKRVKRALERLSVMLKERGFSLTGATLEANLLGMDSPPLPDGMISHLSTQTFRSIGTSHPILSLLKPILAGSALASLAAGGTLILQAPQRETPVTPPSATASRVPVERPDAFAVTIPDGSPLEVIISEVKRLKSGPAHTLTTMQLEVLLGKIEIEQIPEFIALAEERLSPMEQFAVYEPLLKRWAAKSPDAALTYVLGAGIAARRDGAIMGNTLLGNLLSSWLERSREGPAAWMVAHQEHPFLRPGGDGSTLIGFITKGYYLHGNHEAVLRLMDSIHSREMKMNAFAGITGEGMMWKMSGSDKTKRWLDFDRELQLHGAADMKDRLAVLYWRNLSQRDQDDVVKLMENMEPAARYRPPWACWLPASCRNTIMMRTET